MEGRCTSDGCKGTGDKIIGEQVTHEKSLS